MTTKDATRASAHRIINELIAVRPNEVVAIMVDEASPVEMTAALQEATRAVGAEYAVLLQPSRAAETKNMMNPVIEQGLSAADVLIGMTKTSGAPVYSSVVKELLKARKLRVMSLAMRDLDTLTSGGATADYTSVCQDGDRLASLWRAGRVMRITSAAGTDITAPIAHDNVIIECGFVHEAGFMAGLPDGEVSSRPLEGKAQGVIVVDGPAAVVGQPQSPIRIEVEDGKVYRVEGVSAAAAELRRIVETVKNADNIAEFGIGLNPNSRPDGIFQEVKKMLGQAHVALGDNIYYGGSTPSNVHIDMVLRDPTITLDGATIVESGRLRF